MKEDAVWVTNLPCRLTAQLGFELGVEDAPRSSGVHDEVETKRCSYSIMYARFNDHLLTAI